MSLDSYDSRYPLEYYDEGEVYSFYGGINELESASYDMIMRFSDNIDAALSESKNELGDGNWYRYNRSIGVVVGKTARSESKISTITVMFKNPNGEYFIQKYATNNWRGATLDSKEWTKPSHIRPCVEIKHIQKSAGPQTVKE